MRILIADDNQPVRRGVKSLLSAEKDWQVCGEASDGTEALALSRELRPDLVLLDISMPGISGLETSRALREEFPHMKILLMSHHDPIHVLPNSREAGADGCIDKGRLGADLLRVIKALRDVSLPTLGTTS